MPHTLTCPDCSSRERKGSWCDRCHGSGKLVNVELSIPALRKIIQALSTKEQEWYTKAIMANLEKGKSRKVYCEIEAGDYADIRHKLEELMP